LVKCAKEENVRKTDQKEVHNTTSERKEKASAMQSPFYSTNPTASATAPSAPAVPAASTLAPPVYRAGLFVGVGRYWIGVLPAAPVRLPPVLLPVPYSAAQRAALVTFSYVQTLLTTDVNAVNVVCQQRSYK